MERKRVSNPRCYRHKCQANGNREQQIPEEICPDCGTRGEFFGWFQGMWNRIGKKSRLLGFPCTGPQMTFLPTMTRGCGRCEGEGILIGEDFDYECPDCDGNGRFLSRTEEEMRKIRRWALMRHDQYVREKNNPERSTKIPPKKIPDNLILTRDPKALVRGMMNMFEYAKKFSARNNQIGELILQCDDHGWDIFMEMIEFWENSGRRLAVSQDAIQLKASHRKNAVTLLSLCPPSNKQPQRMHLNRQKIRQLIRRGTESKLWERIANLNPANTEWIQVDDRFTREDAREWVLALARTGI